MLLRKPGNDANSHNIKPRHWIETARAVFGQGFTGLFRAWFFFDLTAHITQHELKVVIQNGKAFDSRPILIFKRPIHGVTSFLWLEDGFRIAFLQPDLTP